MSGAAGKAPGGPRGRCEGRSGNGLSGVWAWVRLDVRLTWRGDAGAVAGLIGAKAGEVGAYRRLGWRVRGLGERLSRGVARVSESLCGGDRTGAFPQATGGGLDEGEVKMTMLDNPAGEVEDAAGECSAGPDR